MILRVLLLPRHLPSLDPTWQPKGAFKIIKWIMFLPCRKLSWAFQWHSGYILASSYRLTTLSEVGNPSLLHSLPLLRVLAHNPRPQVPQVLSCFQAFVLATVSPLDFSILAHGMAVSTQGKVPEEQPSLSPQDRAAQPLCVLTVT